MKKVLKVSGYWLYHISCKLRVEKQSSVSKQEVDVAGRNA